MEPITIIFAVFFVLIAILLYVVLRKVQTLSDSKNDDTTLRLQENLLHLSQAITEQRTQFYNQLNAVTSQINERLKENAHFMQESTRSVGERMDNASRVYASVNAKLSQLEESNKRIFDVGKDISSLQEILRSPKLRGALGELFLGDLLAQILPANHFTLQHTFKNNEKVDAIIRLRDGILIPVDAKFPLENFKRVIEAPPEEQREHRKVFVRDVKKHIDAIADKYIVPDEGTLDFALMYIPAENVYYELIIKDDEGEGVMGYALTRRVIPVSPNSFYSYLQTVLLGLKGMQIESSAKEIFKNLTRLRGEFDKFSDQYRVLGSHLAHAQKTYAESEKRLDKFGAKLELSVQKDAEVLEAVAAIDPVEPGI